MNSGSAGWKALGSGNPPFPDDSWQDANGRLATGSEPGWQDPCTSSSTFSLSGNGGKNSGVRKIWAANGGKKALIGFFPPTPAPTPVPTPPPVVNLKTGGGWTINKGDCSINMTTGLPCVVSPNYPKDYGPEQFCNVSVAGFLSFEQFSTEKWFDYVDAGSDLQYSGDVKGQGPNASVLVWSSDFYTEGAGWMICRGKENKPSV